MAKRKAKDQTKRQKKRNLTEQPLVPHDSRYSTHSMGHSGLGALKMCYLMCLPQELYSLVVSYLMVDKVMELPIVSSITEG